MSDEKQVTVSASALWPARIVSAEDFMPVLSVEKAIERKRMINEFIVGVMREGEDYGSMPGDTKREKRKVLLKPGAEKLASIFGLSARYVKETITEDWTGVEHGGEPLFYYEYRCQLWRGDVLMGEAIGSANSWETKYRYRWIREDQLANFGFTDSQHLMSRGGKHTVFEFDFALDKRETTGPYGKPAEYWNAFEQAILDKKTRRIDRDTKRGPQPGHEWDVDETLYRIPNPDATDLINTLQKMGQKRALVAATLVVTNCSDAFTQDIEPDPDGGGKPIGTGGHPEGTREAQNHVRDRKLAETTAGKPSERPSTGAANQAEGSSRVPYHLPASAPQPEQDPFTENLPATLKSLFDGIDAGMVRETFDVIRKQLIELMPDNGEAEIKRVQKARHLTAKSGSWEIKACIRELWEIAEFARQEASKRAPFQATNADLTLEEEPTGEIQ